MHKNFIMAKEKNPYLFLIDKYDYAEFSKEPNDEGQTVLAIYNIDSETLKHLQPKMPIQWDDKRQNDVDESEHGVGQR